jgi:crotonobetainyl-CoA:carnitine CoA-transferase CaiB-like acyl-CoA transferase
MNASPRFGGAIPVAGGDYFLAINRNKRSLAIDLKTESGRNLAFRLITRADVVVQNFRPGVVERLGLAYTDAAAANPGLVYGSLSAYGAEGPLAQDAGMDITVQARSGVMSITGLKNSEPIKPGASLADFSGGVHLVVGILAALRLREVTGRGQHVSVSLLDATMSMLSNYSVAVLDGGAKIEPMGSGHPQIVPFQAFPTSDSYIVIGAGTNRLARELFLVIGLGDLVGDPRFETNDQRVAHRQEVVQRIATQTRQRTTKEWMEVLQKAGIPCAPVNDMAAALHEEQLMQNEMVVELNHPTYGRIHVLGVPYKFSESKCAVEEPPPLLGEDTREGLSALLGLSPSELDDFERSGTIGSLNGPPSVALES